MDDLAGLNWPGTQKKQASGAPSAQRSGGAFTPNYSPSISSNPNPTPSPQSKAQPARDDPFGELVSFSGSSQKSQASMSLRERQQMLEQSRSGSPFSFQQSTQTNSGSTSMFPNTAKDTWNFDALDSTAGPSQAASAPAKPAKPPRTAHVANSIGLDFDPLAAQSQPSNSDLLLSATAPAPPKAAQSVNSKPQEALSFSSDDEPIPMEFEQPQKESFADRDFEIAQVAGYGFSIEQSKAALEITGSPRAAIQLLREQQAAATARQAPRRPEMQQRPAKSRLRTPYRDEPSRADSSSDDDGNGFYYDNNRRHATRDLRQQSDQALSGADSLLASANELGTSMWKQANSWFAMGKQKLMEIQESVEQKRWPGEGAGSRADYEAAEYGASPAQQRYRDYSDSSSDDEPYVSANRYGRPPAKPSRQSELRQPMTRASDPIIDMVDEFDAMPTLKQQQQQTRPSVAPSQSKSTASTSTAQPSTRQSTPAAIPSVAGHILLAASTAKTGANEQFKLGQFGEAILGYSAAIGQVMQHSDSHPVLILLLNNRALAYTRNGEAKMAIADCTQALQLSTRYLANGTIELDQAGRVDIGDQRAKALQRRAEAHEASERYADGLADWKALREIARDTAMRQQSARGVQRCERALGVSQPARPAATPAATPAKPEDLANVFASISMAHVKSGGQTVLTAHTENSAAVAEMRRKDQARRNEDDQRLAINDQVDAELRQWKEGKQHNLRALLCSVHLLLPSFTPIGMHDIIQPAKVKRAYMRTIARLHPDKLAQDVDVRTKMVSSSVFSSLNEAWDTFKAQEGVN
ncbi:auxilin-like clathrin-binding protein required for normal clathrin function [Coemansia sp. RSA 2704]|nr:auxilin-like clathrin-binding protein required for normal clathrin function [Coemansia sp. RSA 2705]KAJ2312380.1 auxilin-like clathrin-binding protein required for normal clathrin function [Coemansia sp. RSA 2704]